MPNPTTRDFLNANPCKKPEMVMQGYDHMIHTLNQATASLKVLNGWIASFPGLHGDEQAHLPEFSEFQYQVERYVRATDQLTEQIVMNAEKIKGLVSLYKQESA